MDRVFIVLSYVCPFSMAENGDVDSVEPMEQGDTATETMETEERTEDYQKLVDYGISEKVASELNKIYKSGKLTKRPWFTSRSLLNPKILPIVNYFRRDLKVVCTQENIPEEIWGGKLLEMTLQM